MDARSQRFLGWYELVGSLAGMLSTGALLAKTSGGLAARVWLLFPAISFLVLGIAGFLLLRGRKDGLPLSVVAQALQLPKVFTIPFSYELYAPPSVSLGVTPDHGSLTLGFEMGGGFSLGLGGEPVASVVGINVAAAAVLWWMLRKPALKPLPTSGGLVTR